MVGLGFTVFYTLTEEDAEAINARRQKKTDPATGPVAEAGQIVPMIVTATNGEIILNADGEQIIHAEDLDPSQSFERRISINGQLVLDGNDSLWKQDVVNAPAEGDGRGYWRTSGRYGGIA